MSLEMKSIEEITRIKKWDDQLKSEIREFFQDRIPNNPINQIEDFVDNFEKISQDFFTSIIEAQQENPYWESPCENCDNPNCDNPNKVWYCRRNS